jgi:metal-responsive CopG/Arc/MetJ family transcriptional regulator
MKRVGLFLTERQIERLRRLSKIEGVSVSELVRKAVDSHLRKHKKELEVDDDNGSRA